MAYTEVSSVSSLGSLTPSLSRAKQVSAVKSNVIAGITDIYTAPAGKMAWIYPRIGVYHQSGSASTYSFRIKTTDGVYHRVTASASVTAANQNIPVTNTGFLLNPGESFSISSTVQGINVFTGITEFDENPSIKRATLYNFSIGDNVLYTVPTGKTANFLTSGSFNSATLTSTGDQSGIIANNTGNTISYSYYVVPFGQAVGDNYKLLAATNIGNTSQAIFGIFSTLSSGDSVVINCDTASNEIFSFINIIEV